MIGNHAGQVRTVAAFRAGLGAMLVARPDLSARLLGARRLDRHPVLRLLGLRHLAEAATLLARPTPGVVAGAVLVDATHVLSCAVFAVASPTHRRSALRDGAAASAVLLATWLTRPQRDGAKGRALSGPTLLEPPPCGPRLVIVTGGRVPAGSLAAQGVQAFIPLAAGAVTGVGRARDSDVKLADPTVSPRHLDLAVDDAGNTRLRDLGSMNGTRVNGIPVETAELHDGDRIDLGESSLVYRTNVDPGPAQAHR